MTLDSTTVRIEGDIERIRYETDDREFQVVLVRTNDDRRVVVVVRGAGLLIDEHVRIQGVESLHNGEKQLEATQIDRLLPSTKEGIIRFLSSDLIPGIGPTFAKRIVDHFGQKTIEILNETPERLQEVAGIGKGRCQTITEGWREHEAVRGIMVFLQSHGISPAFANRIFRQYGQMSVVTVKKDPYQLARDVRGIGFFAADKIAQHVGIGAEDPRRVQAAVEHALHQARIEGHIYLPESILIEHTQELLRRDDLDIAQAIINLCDHGILVREPGGFGPGDAIYMRTQFEEENEIANLLHLLLQHTPALPPLQEEDLVRVRRQFPFQLSREQEHALTTITKHTVSILTGGPGTGKTTIIKALVAHAEKHAKHIRLAAPTGRAAWRLSESTGMPAVTIHRLLEFEPRERAFLRDRSFPIDGDMVIIDESSMLDQFLGCALLRAIAPGTQVVFVGDADQLPPVGAGEVFADLIASHAIETANLNRVFRQGEASAIVIAAHEVREGRFPQLESPPEGEYFFIRRDDPDEALKTLVHIATERMPDAFGLDPLRDIQILAPTHKGTLGNESINRAIQQKWARKGPSISRGDHRMYVGEKVMQTRNNYELEVFNGDVGFIERIDPDTQTMHVQFEGRSIAYGKSDLDNLTLAWSISVHKSQGSEFPAVVLAIATHHYKLLQRNLIYTAMTRAKQRLCIVGSERAFRMAVDHISGVRRMTRLHERIAQQAGLLTVETF